MTDNQEELKKEIRHKNRELSDKDSELNDLRNQLLNQNPQMIEEILKERETIIFEKYSKEIHVYSERIESLQKEIIYLKENNQQENPKQSANFPGEKKQIYDRLFFQEKQIEELQNKFSSALNDNENLKRMLEGNESSKYTIII